MNKHMHVSAGVIAIHAQQNATLQANLIFFHQKIVIFLFNINITHL